MAEIRLLDAVTIGQIAAGEVIERPVSVVKELVENAIDAGATRIRVDLLQGGVELIDVSDDGAGMRPEELPLAVRRHATSKLVRTDDLEAIATLGFRGEGIASIAAVARLSIISRTHDAQIGAKIEAHAEESSEVEPIAAPTGTRIRAEQLFANVPVRREFLRSAQAEFNRVSSWLSTFALAYPAVSFTLRHDGNDIWSLPAVEHLADRLPGVFGRQAAAHLIPLREDAAPSLVGAIRGFISEPGHDRPDRRMQFLFVNARNVRNSAIASAWTAGYSTFAMVGRNPYGVLFLDLPPESVDANVHPAKAEVRLRHQSQVFDAVRRSITSTLHAHATQRLNSQLNLDPASGVSLASQGIDSSLAHVQSLFERVEPDADDSSGTRVRVFSQVNRTYILASDGDAVVLVDQHAAHERIAYEAIVRAAKIKAPSEPLLVPMVVELEATQSEALDSMLEILREGGLDIEAFGERTYRIVATPAGYRARPFDLAGFLDDLRSETKQRDVRERVWASLACHSVTVAGETLEYDEMTTLLQRLQQCENPMHCPHGRPTIIRLAGDDLARLFKRV